MVPPVAASADARPDVFRLTVDERPREPVIWPAGPDPELSDPTP